MLVFPLSLLCMAIPVFTFANGVTAIKTSVDDVVISNSDIEQRNMFLPLIRKADIPVKIGLEACWDDGVYYIETDDGLHGTRTTLKGNAPIRSECSDWFYSRTGNPASYTIKHDRTFNGEPVFFTYHESGTSNLEQIQVRVFEDSERSRSTSDINNRFKGHVMLKAEDKGQLYYISPVSKKAYYIVTPKHTMQIMKGTSIGVSTANIEKVPVGGYCPSTRPNCDNPAKHDQTFANHYKGYIFLEVEEKGEAWYVNPKDGKRYYLGTPENAYNILASASTGISNKDFANLEFAY